ncbi:MAG: GTP pyrophosphokinase, partial [Thermoanaerobaculia bacterium]
ETWERDVLEAERLGDSGLKSRLEDAAFQILEPEAFEEITRRLAKLPAAKKNWLKKRESEIRKALAEAGVRHKALQYRVKHPAGIWRKKLSKGLTLDQIHDVIAFRIIVRDEQDCYLALKAVHEQFEPLLLRFKDYIAQPKENGYRSLHTCIKSPDGLVFEIQIRTLAMHAQAEGGGAAHWNYKAASGWSGSGAIRRSLSGFSEAFRIRRRGPDVPASGGAAGEPAAPETAPPSRGD